MTGSYAGIWLLRLVSAGLCALALTVAFELLDRARERTVVVGLLLAVSPMVLFLAGVVNPNSLEVAATVATWSVQYPPPSRNRRGESSGAMADDSGHGGASGDPVALAALAGGDPRRRRPRRRMRPCPDGAARPSWSPGARGRSRGRGAPGDLDRRFRVGDSDRSGLRPRRADQRHARTVLGRELWWLEQMIGNFGWLDTPAPALTISCGSCWWAASRCWARWCHLDVWCWCWPGSSGWSLRLPGLFELRSEPESGLVRQGCDVLPVAVGGADRGRLHPRSQPARVAALDARNRALVGGAIVVAQVAAYYWALRRYSVGQEGTLAIWSGQAWPPPGGVVLHSWPTPCSGVCSCGGSSAGQPTSTIEKAP